MDVLYQMRDDRKAKTKLTYEELKEEHQLLLSQLKRRFEFHELSPDFKVWGRSIFAHEEIRKPFHWVERMRTKTAVLNDLARQAFDYLVDPTYKIDTTEHLGSCWR